LNIRIPLLSPGWKIPGLLLFLAGAAMLYAYFTGHKPEWLVSKVFAIASFYGEPRYFSVIQTNLLDETGSVFSIFGLLFLFFSRLRHEDPDIHNRLRIKALVQSVWIVAFFWLALFLLLYGYAIFVAGTAVFGLFLLCCNIHFRVQLLLLRRSRRTQ